MFYCIILGPIVLILKECMNLKKFRFSIQIKYCHYSRIFFILSQDRVEKQNGKRNRTVWKKEKHVQRKFKIFQISISPQNFFIIFATLYRAHIIILCISELKMEIINCVCLLLGEINEHFRNILHFHDALFYPIFCIDCKIHTF